MVADNLFPSCTLLLYSIPHVMNFWYVAKLWHTHLWWMVLWYSLAKIAYRIDITLSECWRNVHWLFPSPFYLTYKSGFLYRWGGGVTRLKSYNVNSKALVLRTEINQRQMGARSCAFSFIWIWESWLCLTPELHLDQPSEAGGWSQRRAAWRCSSRNG